MASPTLVCLFWLFTRALGSHPVMTHTSMDVGNIISIIIPESPDTTINIDQLTTDFRRQLERIHKQSRVNKFEHGLVTLKNVLPEMSREEKKKSIPLIRKVLETRQKAPRNSTKESSRKKIQKGKNSRPKGTTKGKPKPTRSSKVKSRSRSTKRPPKERKPVKKPEAYVVEDVDESSTPGGSINDHFERQWFKDDYSTDEPRSGSIGNQGGGGSDDHSTDFYRGEDPPRQSWERDINRTNRRASQVPCSGGVEEPQGQKDSRGFDSGPKSDCERGFDADGMPISCYNGNDESVNGRTVNYPADIHYSRHDDELKELERILENPQESLQMVNLSRRADPPGRGSQGDPGTREHKGFYARRNYVAEEQEPVPYSRDLDVIAKVGRQLGDFGNKNFEIRIQRAVDNHLVGRGGIKSGGRGGRQKINQKRSWKA